MSGSEDDMDEEYEYGSEDMNQSTDEDEFHDYEPYDNEAADAKLPQNIVLDACKCDVNRASYEDHVQKLADNLPDAIKDLETHFICPECGTALTQQNIACAIDANSCHKVDWHFAQVLLREVKHGLTENPSKRSRTDVTESTNLKHAMQIVSAILELQQAMGLGDEKETKVSESQAEPARSSRDTQSATQDENTAQESAKPDPAKSSKKSHGRDRGGGFASGTGYGGSGGYHYYDRNDSEKEDTKGIKQAQAKEQKLDSALLSCLQTVHSCIQIAIGKQEEADSARPPIVICAAVCGLTLPYVLRTLLKNDSLLDIGRRSNLYTEVINLTQFLAGVPEFVHTFAKKMENPCSPTGSNDPSALSVVNALQVLNVQCEVFKRSAEELVDASDEEVAALGLALEINSCFAQMKKSVDKMQKEQSEAEKYRLTLRDHNTQEFDPDSEATKQAELEKEYCNELGEFRVQQWPLVAYQDFYYRKELQAKGSGSKKSLLRLVQEISSLATSLPVAWSTSVFLLTDENRMDIIRAMIIGPEDTPYENGIYLFDIFLPPEYPEVPPKVQFLTTGGGRVRFNPNLYAEGKVCLSLLGTWSGPSWDPQTSTLLQVLVSIQSMILVKDPFFNEPGEESGMGTKSGNDSSNAYNQNIRRQNILVALIPFLQNPPLAFKDTLRAHFRLKHDHILSMLNKWSEIHAGLDVPVAKCKEAMKEFMEREFPR